MIPGGPGGEGEPVFADAHCRRLIGFPSGKTKGGSR